MYIVARTWSCVVSTLLWEVTWSGTVLRRYHLKCYQFDFMSILFTTYYFVFVTSRGLIKISVSLISCAKKKMFSSLWCSYLPVISVYQLSVASCSHIGCSQLRFRVCRDFFMISTKNRNLNNVDIVLTQRMHGYDMKTQLANRISKVSKWTRTEKHIKFNQIRLLLLTILFEYRGIVLYEILS